MAHENANHTRILPIFNFVRLPCMFRALGYSTNEIGIAIDNFYCWEVLMWCKQKWCNEEKESIMIDAIAAQATLLYFDGDDFNVAHLIMIALHLQKVLTPHNCSTCTSSLWKENYGH